MLDFDVGFEKIIMTSKNHTSKTVLAKLIEPLDGLINQCKSKRTCKVLPDHQWIETCLLRTLSQESSGRAFVQKIYDSGRMFLSRSLFFETLKSKRRLKLCREINSMVYKKMLIKKWEHDPFAKFSELDEFDIFAGDGHYHAAAAHDKKKNDKKYPTQHFYAVNLRNQALNHLTLADTSGNRKREHDTRALKRLDTDTLRQSAPKGRKVLYIWDKAGIDFMQWFKWKYSSGIYFISREKENMDLMMMGHLPIDRKDPINAGVLSYDIVGCSAGVTIHRVKYQCPVSGKEYSFVTSLPYVAPGLIAYLYKCRWDIEKVFDQVKNKLSEKKAWATSQTAKTMQAQFICLSHNLMLIYEKHLERNGIINIKENNRRQSRLDKALKNTSFSIKMLPLFLTTPRRASQRPLKFIRWLRNHLYTNTSCKEAEGSLRRIYAVF
ncbi:MAG: transposase [Deltaproteobacteria bacterium]|nr:transposase [Deltaproteobacteria bacterium]